MPSDNFKTLSSVEESRLRRENPSAYELYLIEKYQNSRRSRESLTVETFDAILRSSVFVYLLDEEERALRRSWVDLYSKYKRDRANFEKNATEKERIHADLALKVREKFIKYGLGKEEALQQGLAEAKKEADSELQKSKSLLDLSIKTEKITGPNPEQVQKAQERVEQHSTIADGIKEASVNAKLEEFFPEPIQEQIEEFEEIPDNGEPCQYEMIEKAEDFLAKIIPQMRTTSALDNSADGMNFFEGKGEEGDYFAIQFLLLYLRNLVALYEDKEQFKSPSGAIEALADLMAWKKRDDRLARYREIAKKINSRCYPAIGYMEQIENLLDEKISSFRDKLFRIYEEQIKIASGEVGSHAAISLAGEAMAQFEELLLFEDSAYFQIRQLEEFDKHFKEIADPSYEGLHLIDGANGAKALLSHLKDLRERDDRLNNRFLSVPNKSETFLARLEEIHSKIAEMEEEFSRRLSEIEAKVRSGYDNGGSDAVVLAEAEVQREIDELELAEIEERDAKILLDAEEASIQLFNEEREVVHKAALEEEILLAKQVQQETIDSFNENLEARIALEIQEAEAERLLGQQKIDAIANIMISEIDRIFREEAQKISNSIPAPSQSKSNSLGFFDLLSSAGNFLVSNADAIAALGSTAIVGFGTVEQIKLQEKVAELNEDIARKQLELQEKVTSAQLRLLEVQADSLEGQSEIEQEILSARAELAILQTQRDKKILEATSEFEVLRAQIESQKQQILLKEQETELREIEFAQEVASKIQEERIEVLQEELDSLSDQDIVDFIQKEEIEKAFEQKNEFLSTEAEKEGSSFAPIAAAVVAVLIASSLLIKKGKNNEQGISGK